MRVKILTRSQASNIDSTQWNNLASTSLFVNPFYESWSLLPALEFLQKEDEVYVVATYKDDVLNALFPIRLRQSYFGLQYLSLWQHDHCFICDPLCQKTSDLANIFNFVLRKMKVSMMRIPSHSVLSYGQEIDMKSVVFSTTRGAIFNSNELKTHLDNLPRKIRIENRRITNRLFKETNALYITSRDNPERNWLEDYCQLEHAGWKKKAGGSILSEPSVYDYYSSMYKYTKSSKQMEFQGLFYEQTMLAISFRIISKKQAFELKTTYNEQYKKLCPGVVLEIMNLIDLSNSGFKLIDSSTNSDNDLINRLWPEQRTLVNSSYFNRRLSGKLLKIIYKIKNRLYW